MKDKLYTAKGPYGAMFIGTLEEFNGWLSEESLGIEGCEVYEVGAEVRVFLVAEVIDDK